MSANELLKHPDSWLDWSLLPIKCYTFAQSQDVTRDGVFKIKLLWIFTFPMYLKRQILVFSLYYITVLGLRVC